MTTQTKTTWRKVKLGEIMTTARVNFEKVKTSEYKQTGRLPIFDQGSDAIAGYTDNPKAEYKGKSPAILFGDHTLKLKIAEPPFAIGADGIQILEPDEDMLDRKFFYYAVKGLKVRSYGYERHLKYLRELEIVCPSITEQKRIADILSAFDDKIELNNKISRTLEEMAQAIFKEWFVNFRFPGHEKVKMVDSELGKIPAGWVVKMLPEVFDFLEGPGIRNWQYASSGCRFINIRLIQNNDIDIKSANFISEEEANGKYRHFHLQERDMVVSTSGTLGRLAIVRKEHLPLLLNTSVIRFRPRDKQNYGFMYQFLNSAYFQNKVSSMASGSAQPNFGPVHLKQIDVLLPDKKVLGPFGDLVNPIYERIIAIKSENQKLTALRDLLSPKLMSGEIKV